MVDTWVICSTCGDSVRADDFGEGTALVCDRCEERGGSDDEDDGRGRRGGREGWNEYEQRRWPSRRRRQKR